MGLMMDKQSGSEGIADGSFFISSLLPLSPILLLDGIS
jgi:hypothetical protein